MPCSRLHKSRNHRLPLHAFKAKSTIKAQTLHSCPFWKNSIGFTGALKRIRTSSLPSLHTPAPGSWLLFQGKGITAETQQLWHQPEPLCIYLGSASELLSLWTHTAEGVAPHIQLTFIVHLTAHSPGELHPEARDALPKLILASWKILSFNATS